MFTGIIKQTGEVQKRDNTSLSISAPKNILSKLKLGSSISVNGACLTVVKKNTKGFTADVMPETWKCTSLCGLHGGCLVNLELPLRLSDGLDGHIVQGHVDGMAELVSIKEDSGSHVLTFKAGKDIMEYLVSKGSVTLNGVSLTITNVSKNSFSVSIIPHTWKTTMLYRLGKGDKVNVEVDILSKYIKSFLNK
ncbi:MAG: riboflavin synthase [Candidatus Pacebacteria bacterium]|nr:riboflavin synthase [Candidatus Paceibacterota bacterium]